MAREGCLFFWDAKGSGSTERIPEVAIGAGVLDDRMTGPPVSLEVGVSAPHIGAHRAGERSGAVLTGPASSRLSPALLAAVQPAPFRNTVKRGPNFLL
jgi:hypothetical protein